MPQKKSSTTSKKATKKRRTKKPKVYIPAYKIIILCASIITVCMALLLVTTVKSPESAKISQRYEDKSKIEQVKEPENIKSEKKADSKKEEVKSSPKTAQKSAPARKDNSKPAISENKTSSAEKKSTATKSTSASTESKSAATENKTTGTGNKAAVSDNKPVVSANKPAVTENKPASTENKSATTVNKPASTENKSPVAEPVEAQKKSYNFPQAKNGAQLIFVFDDGGQNLNHLKPFLELPFPITIAVLPRLAHSAESAKRIRASGKELMLHQPMQAVNNNVNPGPGAIKPEMSEGEIISTLFYNINEIGPIAGFNNHEGSAITADAEKMEVVMRIAAENGIFFLDSRTNKDTQVPYVAKEMGYSYYERNGYFLDNEKTKENALKELRRNLDIANKTGSVIMIGHIWSADFLPEFLMEVYPELKEKGYTFTTVTKSKAKKY